MFLSVQLVSIYKRTFLVGSLLLFFQIFFFFPQGKKVEEGKDSDEGESKSEAAKKNQDESIDLYEAHNFDIKLDIDISPEIGRAGLI